MSTCERTMDPALTCLFEKAKADEVETEWDRLERMKPQCRYGDSGLCCRICLQGPCRINPFEADPSKRRGICGAADYTIVARKIIRMIAGGTSAHSNHGRHLVHVLHSFAEGKAPAYRIQDEDKLMRVATRLGLTTEGRTKEQVAKELAEASLFDFMRQDDEPALWLRKTLPEKRLSVLDAHDVLNPNVDKTVTEVMDRTTLGCDADPVPIIFGGIKCAFGDLIGMQISTNVSDILFGTPEVVEAKANLGVLKKDYVNIVVHGHNPMLSEIICDMVDELESEAKAAGAQGITISGICCTANELLVRRGIPVATNFLGADLALATGLVDAMVVDYQCVQPSVSTVSQCYHTHLISTMPTTRIPGDTHIEFREHSAKEDATQIVRLGIQAFKRRDASKIAESEHWTTVVAGFSLEQMKALMAKFNPDEPLMYLVEKLKSGEIQGIGLMAGCNNVKVVHDEAHLVVAKELAKNNVLVLSTGCAAGAYARHGLMSPAAVDEFAGEGLKKVLKELGEKSGVQMPLVFHLGACVDNSRAEDLVTELANLMGTDIHKLPIVASAPEAMSEKAVSIGTWAIATGWPTHVGVFPFISGSSLVNEVATHTAKDVYGGFFIFEPDPQKGADQLINVLKYRRWQLGLSPDPAGIYCYGNVDEDREYKKEELYKMAIDAAIIATGYADVLLNRAIRKFGPDKPVAYPDTGYGLPCIDAWTGVEIKTLGQLPPLLGSVRSRIFEEYTFENARAAGEAVLYSAEIVEALKYIDNENPYNYPEERYCGFVGDHILRKLGLAFVDDTIPGAAVFVGKAKDPKKLVKMVKEFQNKGFLLIATFDIIKQLEDEGVQMGLDLMLYPVGEFTQAIHGASFATRAAMAFGGIKRGQRKELYEYLSKRPKAFVIQLGPLDHIKVGAEFGVIFMGSPTITDQQVEEITDPADPDRVWYTSEPDYDKIVQKCIEVRGCNIKMTGVVDKDGNPLPVAYGPAFEGESIRKADMYFEAGGTRSPAFEWLRMAGEDIEDHKTTLIGKDVDELPEGKAVPLAIVVDIYARKMQKDFESVLERRLHQFINFAEGAMHLGQRNTIWIRISKNAIAAGFKLKHIGDILWSRYHADFTGLVDRVQVTIITDEAKVNELFPEAMKVYDERDARMKGLVDEAVDTFYSCTLCQSFAPNHICVVTPERLGLCGAVNWLDAKASHQISATGPNQPLTKGTTIDDNIGQWEGINQKVNELTSGRLDRFSAYSIIIDPMTSCGCFECILAVVPEANGVLVVNREFGGETPLGMKFSSLAGTVGGGNQVPGFLGVGRKYLSSKKFISADGGFQRIVWMPKHLKEEVMEDLKARAKELGIPEFVDQIADESVAKTIEELVDFLKKVKHPALEMPPIM